MGKLSINKITKAYNKLEEQPIREQPYNNYKCVACKRITKTVDIDGGTTAMGIDCEYCGEASISTFYNDTVPEQHPILEWYKPTLKETLKLRKKQESLLEHVLNGGLLKRYVTEEVLECHSCGEDITHESESLKARETCSNCL